MTGEAGAPQAGLIARLDPAGFGQSVLRVFGRAVMRPAEVAGAWTRFGLALAQVLPAATSLSLGSPMAPPVPADPGDRRFADPSWADNPGYFALRQGYLAARRVGEDLLTAGRGEPLTDQKARLTLPTRSPGDPEVVRVRGPATRRRTF